MLKKNYNACDNKCAHCIDLKYDGLSIKKPDVKQIVNTILLNKDKHDDVLFLGGEPCLYLKELIECIEQIKKETNLKVFVTTSVPKTCYDNFNEFKYLLSIVDGINLSVQHYNEEIADHIRRTKSKFDRQLFYNSLPYKEKIRINLNIVKPFLYTKEDITNCLIYYDKMGFNSIKLSEIQHGKDYFVSFEKTFGIKLHSPFSGGCQTYINVNNLISTDFKTPVLLKRSCFMCEESLNASFLDGIKSISKMFIKQKNNYGVIYENGLLSNGWI